MLELAGPQQDVLRALAHQDDPVTAQLAHEESDVLEHIGGEDFVAFHRHVQASRLVLHGLQEVFRLLDVLQAYARPAWPLWHRDQGDRDERGPTILRQMDDGIDGGHVHAPGKGQQPAQCCHRLLLSRKRTPGADDHAPLTSCSLPL